MFIDEELQFYLTGFFILQRLGRVFGFGALTGLCLRRHHFLQ